MTGPADIQRKVNQLDNDVQAIYEMLGSIQKTQRDHGETLGSISAQQVKMSAVQLRQNNRLEEISDAQAEMKATQLRQGNRLDEVTAVQTEHSATLAEHGTKLDAILELLRRDK